MPEGKITCLRPTIAETIKKPDMVALMEKGLAIMVPLTPGQTTPQTVEYKGATYELAADNQHYQRSREKPKYPT